MARKPRKGLSKTTRFEVFKRDKFTCQYCGRAAPDVVLEVDHIQPVSREGENEILNLITSCKDCNAGKADRQLSDGAVVQKQKAQLDELQERREQIEMMLEWQRGLADLDGFMLEKAHALWRELTPGYMLPESCLADLRKWIRRFGLEETLEAIRGSTQSYLKFEGDSPTQESVNKAFQYIVRVAAARQRTVEKPYMQELYYTRGILRNRVSYCNQDLAIELLEDAYLAGVSLEGLRRAAMHSRSWTAWREAMDALLEGANRNAT